MGAARPPGVMAGAEIVFGVESRQGELCNQRIGAPAPQKDSEGSRPRRMPA